MFQPRIVAGMFLDMLLPVSLHDLSCLLIGHLPRMEERTFPHRTKAEFLRRPRFCIENFGRHHLLLFGALLTAAGCLRFASSVSAQRRSFSVFSASGIAVPESQLFTAC